MAGLEHRLRRIGDLPVIVMKLRQREVMERKQPAAKQRHGVVADRARLRQRKHIADLKAGFQEMHLRVLAQRGALARQAVDEAEPAVMA